MPDLQARTAGTGGFHDRASYFRCHRGRRVGASPGAFQAQVALALGGVSRLIGCRNGASIVGNVRAVPVGPLRRILRHWVWDYAAFPALGCYRVPPVWQEAAEP